MDKELMDAICQLMDAKLSDFEKTVGSKLAQLKVEILDESTHRMNVLLETKVQKQLNLLAEGQQTILERLVPRSRVDDLEEEVKFLKSVVRMMNEDIQQLKMAN